jgi:hypothetical protein
MKKWFSDLASRWSKSHRKSGASPGLRNRRLGMEPLETRELLAIFATMLPAQPAASDGFPRQFVLNGGETEVSAFAVNVASTQTTESKVTRIRGYVAPKELKNVATFHLYVWADFDGDGHYGYDPVPTNTSICRSNGWFSFTMNRTILLEPGETDRFRVTFDTINAPLTGTKVSVVFKDVKVVKASCNNNIGVKYVRTPVINHLIGSETQLDVVQEDLGATAYAAPGATNVPLLQFTTYVSSETGTPIRLQNVSFDVHGSSNVVNNVFSLWTDRNGDGLPDSKVIGNLKPKRGDLIVAPNVVVWDNEEFFLVADGIVANPSGLLSAELDTDDGSYVKARESGKNASRYLVGILTNGVGITGANIVVTTAETTEFGFQPPQPPPTVTLSLAGSPMAEAGGVATVTATLSNVSSQNVAVDLGFSGTATLGADYTRSSTQIVIPAGSLNGSVSLAAVQDLLDEANETVIVDIAGVTNGTESGAQQVTAVIIDDDQTPQPGANLSITDITPANNLDHLGGTEDAIQMVNLHSTAATGVTKFSVTTVLGLGESSLKMYLGSSTTAFATAYVDPSGPTAYGSRSARTFTFTFLPGQFVVNGDTNVTITGVFLPDTQGGIAGEPVQAAEFAGNVSAYEVSTGFALSTNDGDSVFDGEILYGRQTAGPDLTVESPEERIVMATIGSAVNADPNPNGSAIPVGSQVMIGSFTDTAAVNSNSLNGVDQVKIRQLSFVLYVTNVSFDTTTMTVVNSSNIALSAPCSVTQISAGIYSVVSYLDTSSVPATFDSGQSQTFRLRADIFGKTNAAAPATLQVAQDFSYLFLYHDQDQASPHLTDRIFAGSDLANVLGPQLAS